MNENEIYHALYKEIEKLLLGEFANRQRGESYYLDETYHFYLDEDEIYWSTSINEKGLFLYSLKQGYLNDEEMKIEEPDDWTESEIIHSDIAAYAQECVDSIDWENILGARN